MAYADYAFYKNEYFGMAINEEDFSRLALRASQFLDYYTQGRAEKNPELKPLKMACCALAEQYKTIDATQMLMDKSLQDALSPSGQQEVSSETVGGWSRSYRSSADNANAALQAAQKGNVSLASVANLYLANTGFLYRGGRCRNEYVSAHGYDL